MPEENTNSPGKTGEQKTVRPTAMPSGGTDKPSVSKPTVMGGSVQKVGPTVFKASEERKAGPTRIGAANSAPSFPEPDWPQTFKPSAMPGTIRSRISVTLSDLEKVQARIQQPVLTRAIQMVQEFSPDAATISSAVLFGSDIQERHNALVTEGLKLARSEIFAKASRQIGRMMEILRLIRLEKVFGKRSGGFLSRTLKRASQEIDTPEELEDAEREIEQIVALVNNSIGKLLELKAEAESLSAEIEKIRLESEAASVAALYIADYLAKRSRPDIASRFTERSVSLTATSAQIQGGSSIRLLQIEQPLQLISVVQNVVLVTLPGLIASISAMQTMLKGANQPTVTQIDELGDQIRQILDSIKL